MDDTIIVCLFVLLLHKFWGGNKEVDLFVFPNLPLSLSLSLSSSLISETSLVSLLLLIVIPV